MRYETWLRETLTGLVFASLLGGSPELASGQPTVGDPQPRGTHGENASQRPATPETLKSVVEQLYAGAVASGFEERQIVENALNNLVGRVSGYQLQRIYADAVLSNAVPFSVVRQALRELGHRREVWESWPREKANLIYALSIVSGGEPDPVVRERLRTALESLSGRGRGELPPNEGATEPVAEEEEKKGLAVVRQPFATPNAARGTRSTPSTSTKRTYTASGCSGMSGFMVAPVQPVGRLGSYS